MSHWVVRAKRRLRPTLPTPVEPVIDPCFVVSVYLFNLSPSFWPTLICSTPCSVHLALSKYLELRRNLTPHLLAFFFFFQSFQLSISVIPAWTSEPTRVYSGLRELFTDPLLFPPSISVPPSNSRWPLVPFFSSSPLHLCPSLGES